MSSGKYYTRRNGGLKEEEIEALIASALESYGTEVNALIASALETYGSGQVFDDIFSFNIDTLGAGDDRKIITFDYNAPEEFGDGSDGDLTISDHTNFNVYTDLIADASEGESSISVRNASSFSEGMEVMIHQSAVFRGGTFGAYEYHTIVDIDANTITFGDALTQDFLSDSDGRKAENTKAQITNIPHYSNVHFDGDYRIDPGEIWYGYSGGIIAFRCSGTLSGSTGVINAETKGFYRREGQYGNISAAPYAYQGVAGDHGGRSGGGGYYPGTIGTNYTGTNAVPGEGLGPFDLRERLIFGGGTPNDEGSGIVAIYAASITWLGTIKSPAVSRNDQGWPETGGGCVLVISPDQTYSLVLEGGHHQPQLGNGGSGEHQRYDNLGGTATRQIVLSSKKDTDIV